MYKIEKDIPVPQRSGGPNAKYPFRQMEVGDSFFVAPIAGKTTAQTQNVIVSRAGQVKGRKFATRVVDGGVRVWRIG